MSMAEFKIFSGNSNPLLAAQICDYLKVPIGNAVVGAFSDGEVRVRINENIRGRDIFVIQSTCPPVNQNLMELLIIIDALRRASAERITAVLPYYGYARQDRKAEPRVPITAKLVADLITAAGATRVLTLDLHAGQIQGFFDIPVDNLFALPVLINYFKQKDLQDPVVVSPDAGGVERARALAKQLGSSLAIIDKRRTGVNEAEIMNIIGEVEGRDALIVDDMIDTAGTLAQAARAIKNKGALRVFASCTHPVFSGPALDRIRDSSLEEVVATNTIPLCDAARTMGKITELSVAPLLGEAIIRIHDDSSVSSLFRMDKAK
jgi:ribose-phosphate pyrophosphokinase